MDYNTRMLALTPFPYGGRYLQPGDEFFATAIDAGYLTKQGRAAEGKEILEAATPMRRGRPRKEPVELIPAGDAAALGTQEEVAQESSGPVEEPTPQADFTPHFNPPPD
jgi:hypothetical protein